MLIIRTLTELLNDLRNAKTRAEEQAKRALGHRETKTDHKLALAFARGEASAFTRAIEFAEALQREPDSLTTICVDRADLIKKAKAYKTLTEKLPRTIRVTGRFLDAAGNAWLIQGIEQAAAIVEVKAALSAAKDHDGYFTIKLSDGAHKVVRPAPLYPFRAEFGA